MIVDRRFRGAYCLHHTLSTDVSEVLPASIIRVEYLHGSNTQTTALNIILAAVRT
jgi:hypothetical protein